MKKLTPEQLFEKMEILYHEDTDTIIFKTSSSIAYELSNMIVSANSNIILNSEEKVYLNTGPLYDSNYFLDMRHYIENVEEAYKRLATTHLSSAYDNCIDCKL